MSVVLAIGTAALALVLLYRMLALLGGSGTPADRDDAAAEQRRLAQQLNQRRLTDEQRRAVQEAQARLYKPH